MVFHHEPLRDPHSIEAFRVCPKTWIRSTGWKLVPLRLGSECPRRLDEDNPGGMFLLSSLDEQGQILIGGDSMTNQLVKIAGLIALSAATVTGMSLFASNARADEADDDDAAITADDNADDEAAITEDGVNADDDAVNADEGTTAESNDAIIYRGAYRYPGYYYRWPGYRFYPRPFYYGNRYRYYYPPNPYRYYRPPFYGGRVCGLYGCVW